jgi:hypothetical protein
MSSQGAASSALKTLRFKAYFDWCGEALFDIYQGWEEAFLEP